MHKARWLFTLRGTHVYLQEEGHTHTHIYTCVCSETYACLTDPVFSLHGDSFQMALPW